MTPDVWAEIDLSAIAHNIGRLKSLLAPGIKFMAVVKANAYGHGLLPVARQALAAGADCLGVARLGEAVALREGGISAAILIFGYTPPESVGELTAHRLVQTVYSYEIAQKMAAAARKQNTWLPVHVNVDTGMGRLGIVGGLRRSPGDVPGPDPAAVDEIKALSRLPGLSVEGIYTHFATADEVDQTLAAGQLKLFRELTAALAADGLGPLVRHAANSAAMIAIPESRLDMVRAGIAVYGLSPSREFPIEQLDLKPAMTLKARVIHLKEVGAGFPVSYGATEKTREPTTIATVSIGYADGYNRLFSSRGRMRVRGQFAPVIGRVCMDQTMLDVGAIAGVEIGDEVVVFGRDAAGALPVSEIAEALNTISYEVVSGVSDRVARVYCHNE